MKERRNIWQTPRSVTLDIARDRWKRPRQTRCRVRNPVGRRRGRKGKQVGRCVGFLATPNSDTQQRKEIESRINSHVCSFVRLEFVCIPELAFLLPTAIGWVVLLNRNPSGPFVVFSVFPNSLGPPLPGAMTSLQIPDPSYSGSSRQHGASRPVSVSAQPSPTANHQSSSRRQRASHQVVSPQHQQQAVDDQPAFRDVYSHPAAVAYAAAHPRRTIPKFGPYLLLQTVGEGEFGKVKLGLHSQWGEEVAVKLIRRGNIDSSVRMSKVEREIEVLRVSIFCRRWN